MGGDPTDAGRAAAIDSPTGRGRSTAPGLAEAALAAVVLAAIALRWRWLGVPLERDEGEYAYAGWLMLRGVPPYLGIYTMKLPGVHAVYALGQALFGTTSSAVRLLHIAVNAATIIALGGLGRRWLGPWPGVFAAALFALLSAGRPVQGPFANAEHFVLLPALCGLWWLDRTLDRGGPGRLFAAGAIIGLAPLMKQSGAAFVIAALALVAIHGLRTKRPIAAIARIAAPLLAGAVAPALVTLALLAGVGALGAFRHWAIDVAASYATKLSTAASLAALRLRGGRVLAAAPLAWLLVVAGLAACAGDRRLRPRVPELLTLAVCSVAGVSAGLYFRPHYFVLGLPAAALLAAAGLAWIARAAPAGALRAAVAVALAMTAIASTAWVQRAYLFRLDGDGIARATFGRNPFPEAPRIAAWLAERTTPDETIAVLGSEPEIYFLAGRRSATGFIYAYPMMEPRPGAERMQRRMIEQLEAARPAYVVYVAVAASWLRRPDSSATLQRWFDTQTRGELTLVGLIEIDRTGSRFHWGAEARVRPATPDWIAVFERAGRAAPGGGPSALD